MSDSEKSVNSPRTYSCKECNKSFPTPQALGGHQGAHRQPKKPKNAGATSSTAATKTPPPVVVRPIPPSHPSYSPTTTNSTGGGSSGTGLPFELLRPLSNSSSGPSLRERPFFPLAPETTAEGDAKMTNQDPDAKMSNQDPDTTLHL